MYNFIPKEGQSLKMLLAEEEDKILTTNKGKENQKKELIKIFLLGQKLVINMLIKHLNFKFLKEIWDSLVQLIDQMFYFNQLNLV